MNKENLMKMVIGSVCVVLVVLYAVLYHPLVARIKKESQEARQAEAQLQVMRSHADSIVGSEIRTAYVSEEGVSNAINELTALGKNRNIRFISITPSSAQNEKNYKILFVDLNLESRYEDLAVFCGSLDKLRKSLCVLESFDILPDPKNVSEFQTHMVVKMVLLGISNGQE